MLDTDLQACIDTGSGASIIDRSLLPKDLHLLSIVQRTRPVTLKRVRGVQIAHVMVKANVRLAGKTGVDVPVPAYLVGSLVAGLIVGLAQLEEMGARLHLRSKVMEIQGVEVPLTYANTANQGLFYDPPHTLHTHFHRTPRTPGERGRTREFTATQNQSTEGMCRLE